MYNIYKQATKQEKQGRKGEESRRKGERASDWQYSNWHERGNSRGRPQAEANEAETRNKRMYLLFFRRQRIRIYEIVLMLDCHSADAQSKNEVLNAIRQVRMVRECEKCVRVVWVCVCRCVCVVWGVCVRTKQCV